MSPTEPKRPSSLTCRPPSSADDDEVAPSHAKLPVEDKAYQRAVLCVTAKLAAKCSDGSFASHRHARDALAMSAMPLMATELMRHDEPSLRAQDRTSVTPSGSRTAIE